MAQVLGVIETPLHEAARPAPDRNRLALGIGIVIFAALSLWVGIRSQGFLEADACTHYMFARFSFREWDYLVSVWGRPLCTGLYAVPANIGGVIGVRVMSLLLAVVCGLVTYRIARNQRFKYPALGAILLFAQPLFLMHSCSELTEIPFAVVAILAVWAYQARNFLAMTLLVAITPMGRPEGLGLMLLAAMALLAHRRWYYLLLMPLPILLWSYIGWVSWGRPGDLPWYLWLRKNWPYAPRSAYGSGHWYHFIGLLPVLVSPMMFPFLPLGVWSSIRKIFGEAPSNCQLPIPDCRFAIGDPKSATPRTQDSGLRAIFHSHIARCEAVIVGVPLMIFAVHSFLWWQGLMASNGELRYLLCVAPLWALVVARGWEWVWERLRLPAPFIVAGLFATAPIFANYYWRVIPLRLYDSDLMGKAVAQWYQGDSQLQRDYPRVMATPPSIYFFLDLSQSDPKRATRWGPQTVAEKPPGTILFWDPVFGMSNADRNLIISSHKLEELGWIWVGNVVYGGDWCNVYLSPTTASGEPSSEFRYRAPGDVTGEQ